MVDLRNSLSCMHLSLLIFYEGALHQCSLLENGRLTLVRTCFPFWCLSWMYLSFMFSVNTKALIFFLAPKCKMLVLWLILHNISVMKKIKSKIQFVTYMLNEKTNKNNKVKFILYICNLLLYEKNISCLMYWKTTLKVGLAQCWKVKFNTTMTKIRGKKLAR